MTKPLHVTECFQAVGAVNYDYCSEIARERGRDVHLATAYDDNGTLDESTVNAEIGGHLESWRQARRDLKLEILHIEARITVNDVTGQPDRVVLREGKLTVVEIKSGAPDAVAALQLAAYGDLYTDEVVRRIVVHTQSNGTPKIYGELDYPYLCYRSDVITFRSMARTAAWNVLHGRYIQQR